MGPAIQLDQFHCVIALGDIPYPQAGAGTPQAGIRRDRETPTCTAGTDFESQKCFRKHVMWEGALWAEPWGKRLGSFMRTEGGPTPIRCLLCARNCLGVTVTGFHHPPSRGWRSWSGGTETQGQRPEAVDGLPGIELAFSRAVQEVQAQFLVPVHIASLWRV